MTTSAVPILAILPAALFGTIMLGTPRLPAPSIAPKFVQIEHITERRADADTFRRRWPMDLPAPMVIHEVPVVRTVTLPAAPPARIVKRAMLRQDNICTRHGMKRVEYLVRGYKHWRCRR